mgnify:FL=1
MIHSVTGLKPFLSTLAVGTEDAKTLLEFVTNQEVHLEQVQKKLGLAERLLGQYMLDERLIESDHE